MAVIFIASDENVKKYSAGLVILLFLSITPKLNAQHKNRTPFNKDWKFILDSVNDFSAIKANDVQWRKLSLPHDWSIEGQFSKTNPATPGGGALPGGIGWYRKTFSLPLLQKDKSVYIDFDGVYRNSEVFINGHSLGVRPNGYISFQYELTPYLKYGSRPNVIAVKVDNLEQPNSRWYSGSGIFRNVWLTVLDKVHIDNWGTFITTPKISSDEASVVLNTSFQNLDFILKTTIYNAQNRVLDSKLENTKDWIFMDGGTPRRVNITENKNLPVDPPKPVRPFKLTSNFKIKNPILWSLENPYLYKAVSQVIINGKVVDTYTTLFGIRSFNFDIDKGFFLNEKHVKIIGVCDHHDLGALGSAINTRAIERQLQILKTMGCNGIRTSHNPPAPELLALCDKMGFIVMDEAFDMWAKQKTKYDYHLYWDQWHKRDLEDQILRDRNHPSVFIWSIGNEIGEQWGDEKKGDTAGRSIARELVSIVRSLDTTREISTANNEVNTYNNLIRSNAFDLIGYNYNHNIWDKFRERWPGKKMIVTESVSALETRGHYDLLPFDSIRRWPERWDKPFDKGNTDFTVSAYDNVSAPWGSTHEESIKALLKSDHVSGMYIWTGFDYLGEPTPYPWPARSSYFGIVDLAGFPKNVYYLYQSLFTNKPVLHIYPHWNWKEGDTIDVVAYYNNADDVELFINGKSFGVKKKTGDDLHVKWRVPFEHGTLKAVSKKNGKIVLAEEITTAGTPAKIILKADRNKIKSDGKDLSFVTATIVDKNGVMMPTANNNIKFSVKGEGFIAGVDSGDPVSHEPFKADQHTALNGLALAIIQSTGKPGKITLSASSEGLTGLPITIESK
ncbi:MAG: glycoside hydrolase family 2 TIM barrel-domain containing protein [Ginsengibacter sp.]